jgi:phage tail-like protein
MIVAHFQEASGLSVQHEVVKFKEGGLNDREHMLMGPTTYSNIVLKNGMTDDRQMFDWCKKVEGPNRAEARLNGSIIIMNGLTEELVRWNFIRGWPCKWEGPALTGQSSITIETIEIAHEGLRRVK